MADNNKNGCKLYVANLPYSFERSDMYALFSEYGKVMEIHIIPQVEGSPKRYAFISFDTAESATKALALNGTERDGRSIVVQLARARKYGGR